MHTLLEAKRFSTQDAAEVYGVPYWGAGYVDIADNGLCISKASQGSLARHH
ncbi:MAG: hypothetical protein R2865_03715 [Deinococcales bacterium]